MTNCHEAYVSSEPLPLPPWLGSQALQDVGLDVKVTAEQVVANLRILSETTVDAAEIVGSAVVVGRDDLYQLAADLGYSRTFATGAFHSLTHLYVRQTQVARDDYQFPKLRFGSPKRAIKGYGVYYDTFDVASLRDLLASIDSHMANVHNDYAKKLLFHDIGRGHKLSIGEKTLDFWRAVVSEFLPETASDEA